MPCSTSRRPGGTSDSRLRSATRPRAAWVGRHSKRARPAHAAIQRRLNGRRLAARQASSVRAEATPASPIGCRMRAAGESPAPRDSIEIERRDPEHRHPGQAVDGEERRHGVRPREGPRHSPFETDEDGEHGDRPKAREPERGAHPEKSNRVQNEVQARERATGDRLGPAPREHVGQQRVAEIVGALSLLDRCDGPADLACGEERPTASRALRAFEPVVHARVRVGSRVDVRRAPLATQRERQRSAGHEQHDADESWPAHVVPILQFPAAVKPVLDDLVVDAVSRNGSWIATGSSPS